MPTDDRVDAYMAKRAEFAQPILSEIRARMHAACPEVEEAIKWGMPAFLYRGRPLANMAAFKAHASFGFWAREGIETGKEGEAMGQFGQLKRVADLPDKASFEKLVHEAIALIEAGAPTRARRAPKPEAEVPAALAEALAKDPAAKANFDAFPPGARREYCEWIADAKRDSTRDKRVADAVAWLREGKKRNWKYENC